MEIGIDSFAAAYDDSSLQMSKIKTAKVKKKKKKK